MTDYLLPVPVKRRPQDTHRCYYHHQTTSKHEMLTINQEATSVEQPRFTKIEKEPHTKAQHTGRPFLLQNSGVLGSEGTACVTKSGVKLDVIEAMESKQAKLEKPELLDPDH